MSVDTFTTNLNLTKPGVGGSADTWGGKINANLDTIDGEIHDNATAIAALQSGKQDVSGLGNAAFQNLANASQVRAGTGNTVLSSSNIYGAAAPVISSGSGTWTPNFGAGRVFERTMTGNTTLAAPTNAIAGMSGVIFLKQDGTGGRNLTYAGNYSIAGGEPLIPSNSNALFGFGYFAMSSSDIRLTYMGEFV